MNKPIALAILACLLHSPTVYSAPMFPLHGNRGFNIGGLDNGRIDDLAATGADIVRIQIHYNLPDAPNTIEGWFPLIDPAINQIVNHNQIAVLEIHNPTPGRGKNGIDNGTFYSDWDKISNRYKGLGRPNQIWYDLWNEPPDNSGVRRALQGAGETIRANGDRHPIVVPKPGDRSIGIDRWEPLEGVSRQIIGTHFWDYHALTHDFEAPYIPYPNDNKSRNRRNLRQRLDQIAAVADQYDLPVFIGELGMHAQHPDADVYFQDVLGIIERRHPDFNVALHAWREAPVWDYEGTESWPIISSFVGDACLRSLLEDGDFDQDGDVDGNDFLALQRRVSSNQDRADDLIAWRTGYGGSAGSLRDFANAQAIPEPTTIGLILFAALLTLCGRQNLTCSE